MPFRPGYAQTFLSLLEVLSASHAKLVKLLGPMFSARVAAYAQTLAASVSYLFRTQICLFPTADDLLWNITFIFTDIGGRRCAQLSSAELCLKSTRCVNPHSV